MDIWQLKIIKIGPWYNDDENEPTRLSCRHLEICITEYEAQGLELDAVLLAWGTDFSLQNGEWSIKKSRKYRKGQNSSQPAQVAC